MDAERTTGGSPEALVLALVIDQTLGEPPTRWHPVAWMGSAIDGAASACARRLPSTNGTRIHEWGIRVFVSHSWTAVAESTRLAPLAWGALIAVGGALASAGAGCAIQAALRRLPPALRWPIEAAVLKTTLSAHGLAAAAQEVERALLDGDLVEARRALSWHLVSRDTSALSAAQVAAATIESVAENTSDGVVAPLVYYALGGLPAALAYRFLNTADAMLGYRDARREWLGKAPARADDVANLLPSRLTAGLLTLSAWLLGEDAGNAWRVWRRDAGKTASPNAGHPMSAAAGALGVTLEKIDHYCLGEGQRLPEPGDIHRAVRLMTWATLLAAGLCALLAWLRRARQEA